MAQAQLKFEMHELRILCRYTHHTNYTDYRNSDDNDTLTHTRTQLVHSGEVKRQMLNDVQPGEMDNTFQWWIIMAASHSTQKQRPH